MQWILTNANIKNAGIINWGFFDADSASPGVHKIKTSYVQNGL